MKELKIAWSNIKRRKSSAITLVAITLIATVMLAISLSLLTGMGSLFDRRATALNAPDMSFAVSGGQWIEEFNDHLVQAEGLNAYMVRDGFIGSVRYDLDGRLIRNEFVFSLAPETGTEINTLEIIDSVQVQPNNHITLPLMFRSSGFRAGDDIEILSAGISYNFTIYGFYENILLGSPTAPAFMVYVSSGFLDSLYYDNNFRPITIVCVRFDTREQADTWWGNFMSFVGDFDGISMPFHENLISTRGYATSFSLIMASILSLVALIFVVIAIVVARFSVVNNIEQDVQTLGALKGMGYSNRQIIWSVVLQFFIIAAVGVLLGIVVAVLLMNPVGNMVAATSGLLWGGIGMVLPVIISIFAVLGLIVGATYLIARKTKKVTPITALRSGIQTHSFKKSATNLEKTKLSLNLNMAIKQFKSNFKRNVAAIITLMMFAFVGVLGFTLHYNFVVNTDAYRDMVAIEPAQLLVLASDVDFINERFEEIANHENVRKAVHTDMLVLGVSGDRGFMVSIWEDMTEREASPIVRGRFPIANNEVTLTAQVSSWLGYGLGDTMLFGRQGTDLVANFLVVGITQGWGGGADMTLGGLERISEEPPVLRRMLLYLYDGSPSATTNLSNELISEFGRELTVSNNLENFDEFMAQMQPPIAVAMWVIMIVVLVVTALVFLLMANTIINRSKKEVGILKAMGFTTRQLIIQLLLSFLPIILGSVIVGAILGMVLTNPLASLMFAGLGIARATFTIVPWLVVLTAGMLIALSIAALVIVSLIKYKKATARSLMTE